MRQLERVARIGIKKKKMQCTNLEKMKISGMGMIELREKNLVEL